MEVISLSLVCLTSWITHLHRQLGNFGEELRHSYAFRKEFIAFFL